MPILIVLRILLTLGPARGRLVKPASREVRSARALAGSPWSADEGADPAGWHRAAGGGADQRHVRSHFAGHHEAPVRGAGHGSGPERGADADDLAGFEHGRS